MNIGYSSNMPTLKVRRQKFGIFSLLIMLFVGIVFIVLGSKFIGMNKIDPSWKHIDGNVVSSSTNIGSGSTTYNAVVQYTVNGQSYKVVSNSGSSALPAIGSTRQVAYDPAIPGTAKVVASSATNAMLYIFPAVGVLLIVLGPVLFVRSMRRNKDIANLKQTGQKIQGVLVDIQTTNSGSTVTNHYGNNSNRYRLVVTGADASGNSRNYTSDWLSGIAGLAMTDYRTNPVPMDVYVDSSNPDNYYVDISDVPNLTPERIKELTSLGMHRQQPESFVPGQTPVGVQPTPPASPVAPVTMQPPAAPVQSSQTPPPTTPPTAH